MTPKLANDTVLPLKIDRAFVKDIRNHAGRAVTIRILLADDHAVMREGLKALLETAAGMTVVAEASNGREALRRTLEFEPDIVVMDIGMPEMNGVEATRLLREKCPETRVVILSMHADAEHVFRALEAGAAGYLIKESAGVEVVAAVRAVSAGRRYLSASIAHLKTSAASRAASPLDSLSTRERQVLPLVAEGRSSAEIAVIIDLSPKSVETYRSRLMKKLDISNVTALVKFAVQHGLVPPG